MHSAIPVLLVVIAASAHASGPDSAHALYDHGGIIRLDTTRREIYLVFTGHDFGEGAASIRETLHRQGVPASFFFTGDFYRTASFRESILGLHADGHYLGPHSDKHLLYVAWENRDSLLVSRTEFLKDLFDNTAAMESLGIPGLRARTFLPAYEWYNDSIATWCNGAGFSLVNFTPGTSSNADYTTPGQGKRYVSSDSIMARILRYEQRSPSGMNGFLLLIHFGTDPARTDKLYSRLDTLISILRSRGYHFRRFSYE
jgi:endoglucanase